ncbi:conserved hypothetical protein [Methylocella tundrae]|nr:conserved hypothetical protein [Methylocella tundrae]
MPEPKRFTPQFEEGAVRLVRTSGRTQREVAHDLGIGLSTLVRWIARGRDRLIEAPAAPAGGESVAQLIYISAERMDTAVDRRFNIFGSTKGVCNMRLIHTIAVSALTIAASITIASAQTGPVATACKDDIAKLCAGKAHDGEVRICLETNYDRVSAACKTALDTTGGGHGKGLGMGR